MSHPRLSIPGSFPRSATTPPPTSPTSSVYSSAAEQAFRPSIIRITLNAALSPAITVKEEERAVFHVTVDYEELSKGNVSVDTLSPVHRSERLRSSPPRINATPKSSRSSASPQPQPQSARSTPTGDIPPSIRPSRGSTSSDSTHTISESLRYPSPSSIIPQEVEVGTTSNVPRSPTTRHCKGLTRDGESCQRRLKSGSYCAHHMEQEDWHSREGYCRGTTNKSKLCRNIANYDGFCHFHRPDRQNLCMGFTKKKAPCRNPGTKDGYCRLHVDQAIDTETDARYPMRSEAASSSKQLFSHSKL